MSVAPPRRAAGFHPAFPLIESKIHAPTVPAAAIPRPHLLEALASPAAPPIVALIAPPGYGKTTLLAQWAASAPRSVAWLTLDDQDNDPVVLVSYLAAALARVGPVGADVGEGLTGIRGAVLATAVPRIASALHRWRGSAVLVLDDVHRLVDRDGLDAVTALLDHLPAGVRVALSGRTDPGLALPRLRVQCRLLELGPGRLALDDRETAEVARRTGCELTDEEARALAARTEGWAAGVYLAALDTGAGQPSVARPVSGADPSVAAYLRSEVGRGLDEADMRLLTRTSIVEAVTPALAGVLCDAADGSWRLDRIARGNLLVRQVRGSRETSYRYHNLLRDFLSMELDRREPSIRAELHRRAAAWYEDAGTWELAVEQAHASGDRDLAARLVSRLGLQAHYRGQLMTVDRWVARFAEEDVVRNPPLAVVAAWVCAVTGRAHQADRFAAIANASTYDGPAHNGAASFASARALLASAMMPNGPRQARDDAAFAVSVEQPGRPWRPIALMTAGALDFLLGADDAAEASLTTAAELGRESAPATRMNALAIGAVLAIRRRNWMRAEVLAHGSREQLDEARYGGFISCLLPYAVSARVAAHRGDAGRAREELVRAQLVRPLASHAAPWLSVMGLLEIVRAYLAVSDRGGAQLALREAEAIVRHRPDLGVLTGDALELRQKLASATLTLAGSSALTNAELRVLPFLPTYLSFQDIADRLVISRNTVKSHAMSIYGKLMASSRAEAVERAVELGLLEPYPGMVTSVPGVPDARD